MISVFSYGTVASSLNDNNAEINLWEWRAAKSFSILDIKAAFHPPDLKNTDLFPSKLYDPVLICLFDCIIITAVPPFLQIPLSR